jgi:YfiH family protein
MFKEVRARIPYFQFKELRAAPGFVHAFSSRTPALEVKDAQREGQVAQIKPFLNNLDIHPRELVLLRQVHSAKVVRVGKPIIESRLPRKMGPADGLILIGPGVFGVIRTADCVPILVVDPSARATALIHAGWRGTRDRILRKGVEELLSATGAAPEDLTAAIGPCIRDCCYEVGDELKPQFLSAGYRVDTLFQGRTLDLVQANLENLNSAGISRVLDSGVCTACQADKFYSYRRRQDEFRSWMVAGFRY